jgi:hypothetical protein
VPSSEENERPEVQACQPELAKAKAWRGLRVWEIFEAVDESGKRLEFNPVRYEAVIERETEVGFALDKMTVASDETDHGSVKLGCRLSSMSVIEDEFPKCVRQEVSWERFEEDLRMIPYEMQIGRIRDEDFAAEDSLLVER